MNSSPLSPPAFNWDLWYNSVGGRTINIPEVKEYMRKIHEEQYALFEGPVAKTKTNFGTPEQTANHLKEKAKEFGADIVGICEIEPSDIYRGRSVTQKYAIALGKRMLYRSFQEVPNADSAYECIRIYYSLGETVIKLAQYIRDNGYEAVVEHPVGDSDLLHIPIGLKAGFGELGRHGSIIHPTLGPLFRMGSVAISIPIKIDKPIDAGIAAFCDKCKACRIYCPAKAIPDERDSKAGKDHLGNDRYLVDTGKCFPYFAKNNYCSICLPVCVYNHKEWAKDFEGHQTKKFPEVIMNEPPEPSDAVPNELKHYYPKNNR